MSYHSYVDPLEVAASTNSSMNAIAPGGAPAVATPLPAAYGGGLGSAYGSNYVQGADTPGSAYGSNYVQGEAAPAVDEDGFPAFGGKGSAKQSWNLARAGVKAGVIDGMDHGKNKGLSRGYRLEALDPKHRMADLLEIMHKEFEKRTDAATSCKVSLFFEWLDMLSREAPETIYGTFKGFKTAIVNNFVVAGVRYLTARERSDFRVFIKGGLLYRGNKLMDSRDNSTVVSGKGWAIFVTNPSGQLYAGSHSAGQFHHSSFLAGRPVMSAGELKVENGVIKVLTAKSGHYKPTLEQFIAGVKELKQRGADLEFAKLRMFKGKVEQLVPANFYLATPGVFRGLTVWD
jgi:hypothetical protein